jgi:hypothetical protein
MRGDRCVMEAAVPYRATASLVGKRLPWYILAQRHRLAGSNWRWEAPRCERALPVGIVGSSWGGRKSVFSMTEV